MSPASPLPHPVDEPRAAPRLLVVDDDVELCALVGEFLRREGFEADFAHDGPTGLKLALEARHAAIVLDVMLPGLGGFEVLKKLRRQRATPVLMLTARGDHVDRIVGLELGADDYIPKPFDPRELVARIRAVLRRTSAPAEPAEHPERLRCGEIVVDLGARAAWRGGTEISLTLVEFTLLVELMRAGGRYLSREQLSLVALGRPLDPEDRSSVDMHISKLRKKLGNDETGESFIRTVRNAGYRIPSPPSTDRG